MISAVMPNYARKDLAFVRGEGVYLVDGQGRRYLDFCAGIAVTALGHCHPHLVETLQAQAGKLWHCSNLYQIPEQDRLAERLVDATFADSVFFCNSGAEAVECGLKLVRKYQDDHGAPERYRIVTCAGGFHGRTLATIAAGAQAKHTAGFTPLPEGFDQVAFGNLNELRAAITPETAAILVEPVQGEGGVRPATLDYLRELRRIADEFGVLLYFDEVQTGVGRTGKLFAYEWAGIEPDLLSVAKGLGGGFPVGACLAKEHVAASLTPGSHGSTFGGNPLAMAVGNAVLDVLLADGFLDAVDAKARILWRRLEKVVVSHPRIFKGLRGAGMLLALECEVENTRIIDRLEESGLLAVAAGDNVVRLVPPLIIEEQHIDEAVSVIDRVSAELEHVSSI